MLISWIYMCFGSVCGIRKPRNAAKYDRYRFQEISFSFICTPTLRSDRRPNQRSGQDCR